MAEPAALSACPAHSSHAAHVMGGMGAMDGPGDAMPAHHAEHRGDSSNQHSTKHCSCLGECCCTPSVAPVATAVAALPPAIVVHAAPTAACESVAQTSAPHTLPFANGPPSDIVA